MVTREELYAERDRVKPILAKLYRMGYNDDCWAVAKLDELLNRSWVEMSITDPEKMTAMYNELHEWVQLNPEPENVL